jgi:hypothetical protein
VAKGKGFHSTPCTFSSGDGPIERKGEGDSKIKSASLKVRKASLILQHFEEKNIGPLRSDVDPDSAGFPQNPPSKVRMAGPPVSKMPF